MPSSEKTNDVAPSSLYSAAANTARENTSTVSTARTHAGIRFNAVLSFIYIFLSDFDLRSEFFISDAPFVLSDTSIHRIPKTQLKKSKKFL